MEFIIDEVNMTKELDESIKSSLCLCFPSDIDAFSNTRAWHGSSPLYSVAINDENNVVLAHIGVVDRTISVGDTSVRVAGVQNVLVIPSERGKGHVDKVIKMAMAEAGVRNFDAGLLFCVPELEKVYARAGFIKIPDVEFTRIDENNNVLPIPGKNIAMYYPLKIKSFPKGNIFLCGNDW